MFLMFFLVSRMSAFLPKFQGIKNWNFKNLKTSYRNINIQDLGTVYKSE